MSRRGDDDNSSNLHFFLVLNLANIFITFIIMMLNIQREFNAMQPIRYHTRQVDDNILANYQIHFEDICEDTYSDNSPNESDKCSICLETFQDVSGNIIVTVNCNHYFHRECLREWFKRRLTCPYCNVNLAARHIEHNH